MSEIKKIVVLGEEIVENKILNISTSLSNNRYFFLTGTVYAPDNKPISNAAIKIFITTEYQGTLIHEFLSVIFTDDDGLYGISLLIGKTYTLVVYS